MFLDALAYGDRAERLRLGDHVRKHDIWDARFRSILQPTFPRAVTRRNGVA